MVVRCFAGGPTQLLGAVASKLLFSFLLGTMLAVLGILANLEALGWWTQWLLMSAFWWAAFARRHQVLQAAGGAIGRDGGGERRTVTRRVSAALDPPRKLVSDVRAAKQRLSKRGPEVAPGADAPTGSAGRSRGIVPREQAERSLAVERREARAHVRSAPQVEARTGSMRERLQRVDAEREAALKRGEVRRAATLQARAGRITVRSWRRSNA